MASSSDWSLRGAVTTNADAAPTSTTRTEREMAREAARTKRESRADESRLLFKLTPGFWEENAAPPTRDLPSPPLRSRTGEGLQGRPAGRERRKTPRGIAAPEPEEDSLPMAKMCGEEGEQGRERRSEGAVAITAAEAILARTAAAKRVAVEAPGCFTRLRLASFSLTSCGTCARFQKSPAPLATDRRGAIELTLGWSLETGDVDILLGPSVSLGAHGVGCI